MSNKMFTLKNETIVTCGRRLCPAFHTHSSRVSYQKFSNCSPNVPIGIAYSAYSRIVGSSNLGSLICDTSQFIAFSADALPVAANAFSLNYQTQTQKHFISKIQFQQEVLKIRFYRFQQLRVIKSSIFGQLESLFVYRNFYYTYALCRAIPNCINIWNGVFSCRTNVVLGRFFRVGATNGILKVILMCDDCKIKQKTTKKQKDNVCVYTN